MALEGTIVMSDDLKATLDNMFDARVPETWKKISWRSTTLGFWYTELLERDGQFKRWCFHGRPKVFWITGFFNPQVRILTLNFQDSILHILGILDCNATRSDSSPQGLGSGQCHLPESCYQVNIMDAIMKPLPKLSRLQVQQRRHPRLSTRGGLRARTLPRGRLP